MIARLLGVLACIAAVPATLTAQDTSAVSAARSASDAAVRDVRECWRFGFGAWEPALDWLAAGHEGRTPMDYLSAVARGRVARPDPAPASSAAWNAAAGDTLLLIFPDWWPAGVSLRIEALRSDADTLRGVATALVANGSVRNPVSRIVAIRRSCGDAPPR